MSIHKVRNCSIVIKQEENGKIKTDTFTFDDYRIAVAIANLLCNMSYVYHNHHTQKGE